MKIADYRDQRITVLVDENPKRAKTLAYQAFALLRTGMTVTEYLALEGHRTTLDAHPGWATRELRWCLKKAFIRLDPIAPSAEGATPANPTSA